MVVVCTTGVKIQDARFSGMVEERRSVVQSVTRAFQILEVLKNSTQPMTARHIGEVAGLDRTVTYRLLCSLRSGELAREVGGKWRLDVGALDLGFAYLNDLPFASVAPAFAMDLYNRVVRGNPWLVALGVPVGDHVMLIDRFWTEDSPLNATVSVGTRIRMDTSATGLAILSRMSAAEGQRCLGSDAYEAVSRQIDTVRANGHIGMVRDTLRPGSSAIAAAVCDREGRVVGAVNISGLHLEEHLSPDSTLSQEVGRTAAAIAAAL
jgi:IclR family transcriptional regulator, acetate operon repressor